MNPKDDLRPQSAIRWLNKAKRDSDTAFLNDRHGGYADVTCYFAHQTVEKSLKAFLVYHSLKFRKTHHLPLLLKLCVQKEPEFIEFEDVCLNLNDYYIESKYPMDLPVVYTKEEAQEALTAAEKVCNFVKLRFTDVYNEEAATESST